MLENKLIELLANEIITEEELNYIEEHEQVISVENCGTSAQYIGYTWYNVTTDDGEEYSIYL